ncbi:hypothetical protein [Neolewinella antarctica]|uniref:Inner membrane protein involved in colicin E2 resistance n=1 Tax=Neolewinella antarctica TaxID=442734 RepID=A0ABX0X7K7_9BACT|nr:hypothetical protein [Neolewinella antarctica]NJC24843.1 inner membrane protein involved in colicin E2 resistance [Neolewinella antarctica]
MNYVLAFLAQAVLYLVCLVLDEYAGMLFAMIIGSICGFIWVVSLIVELIEPSRVAKAYYRYITTGWLAPASALVLYVVLRGGFEWMRL